jgi:hypothetical protein
MALGATPAAAQIQVSGSGRQATLDCNGGTAAITGGGNELRIRGPCRKVAVTGARNTIVIESVGAIELSGAMNHVTWLQGLEGRSPRISRTGVGNTVVQGAGRPAPAPTASAPRHGSNAGFQGGNAVELLFDGAERTIACDGRAMALMGSRNSVTLHGRCPLVRVTGDANLLSVDDPDAIVVTGDRNQVSWRSARAPSVNNTGRGNQIGPARP